MAWRASGQRAEEFSTGKEFTAASLRHWAWQLGLTRRRRSAGQMSQAEQVPLARVVRLAAPSSARSERGSVYIEIDGARVEVRADADEGTLAKVMRALAARRGGAEERP